MGENALGDLPQVVVFSRTEFEDIGTGLHQDFRYIRGSDVVWTL